ncbi:glycoside hydrolase family 31 protein [Mucilaginibacter sp. Mucisp86]|uniref:glycoside hydrolase family 31 protein n=1 Tax=Mucilaginibacter sp. Mucisp86 TaxID=3243060 RepID=UPI0039B612F9
MRKLQKRLINYYIIIAFCLPISAFAQATKLANGILLKNGKQKLLVEFVNPTIVRVRYVPDGDFKENNTYVCLPRKQNKVKCLVTLTDRKIILRSAKIYVEVQRNSGSIRYFDLSGHLLLAENAAQPRQSENVYLNKATYNDSGAKIEKTANGEQLSANIAGQVKVGEAWKVRQQFAWQADEALYGLGSHQEDYMNLRGTKQFLYEHNLKKSIPVLMSSKGYGLLFDAGCAMVFHDDTEGSYMEMEAVNQLDYYFMYGPEMDQTVRQFRTLTGKVELPPKYAFGYVQSKERYVNQHDIDSVLSRFRSSHIPIDVIVQDWQYWKDGLWGFKKFDSVKFPNPKQMIEEVHKKNAHFMLSIWPNVAANEQTEMSKSGFVLGRNIYNALNPAARAMYWSSYVGKELYSKGVDAWWCDSSEPVEFDWNQEANSIAHDPVARFEKNVAVMSDLLGQMNVNLYSLHHTMGIYENQRKSGNNNRVFILTRASYAGQQRYGTMVWNGDIKATWSDFKNWIPAGLNYMATGSPYWTIDAGAFFVKAREQWFWKGEFENGTADSGYREFYVRNLQFAGWLPLFRSHGTDFAREPWQFGKPGEMFYDAILKQIDLRYQLMPYIYSTAASVTFDDYTMTRPLVFDFRQDTTVYNIKDEFMFGPSFLVCPVTNPMYFGPQNTVLNKPHTRSVYLPAKTKWVDFWTNEFIEGGRTIISDAPISHIPVFVKAGSIIPVGPVITYATEPVNSAVELRIYAGQNGKFDYYEDDGTSYEYKRNRYAKFTINWNDKKQLLTIGNRHGTFNGLVKKRKFKLIYISPDSNGHAKYNIAIKTISYNGRQLKIRFSSPK